MPKSKGENKETKPKRQKGKRKGGPAKEFHGCPPGGRPGAPNPPALLPAAARLPPRTGRPQQGSYTQLPPRCQPASALEDPCRAAAGQAPAGGALRGMPRQAPRPDRRRAATSARAHLSAPGVGLPKYPQAPMVGPFGALPRTLWRAWEVYLGPRWRRSAPRYVVTERAPVGCSKTARVRGNSFR